MQWPLLGDVGGTWYCKPRSGKLPVSPAGIMAEGLVLADLRPRRFG